MNIFSHTQVFDIGEYRSSGRGKSKPIIGQTLGIVWFQRGSGSVTVDDQVCELVTGMACFAPCKNYFSFSCLGKTRSTVTYCLTDLSKMPNSIILQLHELLSVFPATDHLRKIFKLATGLNDTHDQSAEDYRNALGELLFAEVMGNIDKDISVTECPEAVIKLKKHIEKHFATDFDPDYPAQMFGMSSQYLSKLFIKHIGCSPAVYLWKTRREAALELLCSTTLSLRRVADSCGFKSINHFSSHMKKHFTYAPSELRRRYLYDASSAGAPGTRWLRPTERTA